MVSEPEAPGAFMGMGLQIGFKNPCRGEGIARFGTADVGGAVAVAAGGAEARRLGG